MTKKSKKSKRNRKNFKKPLAILFLVIITGALTLHVLNSHLQNPNNPITNLIQNLNEPEKIIPQDELSLIREWDQKALVGDYYNPSIQGERPMLKSIPKPDVVDPDFFNPIEGCTLNTTIPIWKSPPWMEVP